MVSEMQISSGWRPALPAVAWLQAVIATTGSLYFSEVMHLSPCTLCWYQRLMMYPLVFVPRLPDRRIAVLHGGRRTAR